MAIARARSGQWVLLLFLCTRLAAAVHPDAPSLPPGAAPRPSTCPINPTNCIVPNAKAAESQTHERFNPALQACCHHTPPWRQACACTPAALPHPAPHPAAAAKALPAPMLPPPPPPPPPRGVPSAVRQALPTPLSALAAAMLRLFSSRPLSVHTLWGSALGAGPPLTAACKGAASPQSPATQRRVVVKKLERSSATQAAKQQSVDPTNQLPLHLHPPPSPTLTRSRWSLPAASLVSPGPAGHADSAPCGASAAACCSLASTPCWCRICWAVAWGIISAPAATEALARGRPDRGAPAHSTEGICLVRGEGRVKRPRRRWHGAGLTRGGGACAVCGGGAQGWRCRGRGGQARRAGDGMHLSRGGGGGGGARVKG
jgi:hypothetical protein